MWVQCGRFDFNHKRWMFVGRVIKEVLHFNIGKR